ncbi:MAG: NAD(P)H-hydrate dehydratase [Sulfolobales archaeon]|nr:NAD(P)H-hydrate dehydratase [Sulfolobales archaeon]MCX8208501.1 NAD(P)H-hydrate dehydratase [Sulfolobales archaeon]MDW8010809.1 NAD(P)H-hydrate dehydratase [Sulfolobales archaeon]
MNSNVPRYRMKVCYGREMKEIDSRAVREYGISELILMENAGSAVYHLISREFGCSGIKAAVVAGTGNNGGDALVVARRLHSCGAEVEVFVVGDPEKYPEPARRNYELVLNLKIPTKHVNSPEDLNYLEDMLKQADVVVVGLIGIGLKGEVRGIYKDVIDAVNRSGRKVVSVDIPSGISGDSGRVCGVAVKSSYTVTFGLPKLGNILYPGYYYCGKLYVSTLSYPPELLFSNDIKVELNVPEPVPERVRWGHKGTFGKLLTVGGARYYYGAPYYASYSFLKAGGGYSRLAAPKSVVPYVAARCSEVVYIPLEETEEGSISMRNLDRVLDLVEKFDIDIVAVGSGMSLNPETQEFAREIVRSVRKPVIVDGDGITAISSALEVLKSRSAPTVVTPHLAEFSRLSGIGMSEVVEDPVGALRRVSMELNSYIVLKGAHSLIGYPDGYVYVNMTGNPGMAKAGSGDVLTGTIAAMYGIGFRDLGVATRMGVLVHGLAGDLAAEELGEDGITPDDILNKLPEAVRVLREKPDLLIRKYMPEVI